MRSEERVVYVSRAGFYLSTETATQTADIIPRYYHLVTQPWFTQQTERNNRARDAVPVMVKIDGYAGGDHALVARPG